MSKNNVVVSYQNLHPSEETRAFVESVIGEIHQELPKGSKVKATFTAKDDVIKGILQAGSHGRPFFAVAASTNLKEISMRLLMLMRRRLEKVKSKNYRRLSVKDLPVREDYFRYINEAETEAAS